MDASQKRYNRRTMLENLISDEAGKEFILDLLALTGVLGQSCFVKCGYSQAFQEGKRNIGAHLYRLLEENIPREFFGILSTQRLELIAKREALKNE